MRPGLIWHFGQTSNGVKKKNTTIDQLAIMVNKGFNEVTDKMATKIELEKGFKEVNRKLDRIENELIGEHSEEIKHLKERVRKLENALAIE